ncbi:MAG: ChbG/HpnK family deacetylase [Chloroflexi bacterium]|nr:ChbG/HpnK family deacetylase [Chloroflexota bacterium]
MASRLLITCDDCGLCEGINEAALRLFHEGLAHSASVMSNMPAAAHALALYRPFPAFNIGAHLNLTEGAALTGVSALTDAEGRFLRIDHIRRLLHTSADFLSAAEAEFDAQMAVFLGAGVQPEHVTTHMHFHVVPALRDVVLRTARRYRAQWVRAYRVRHTLMPRNWLARLPNRYEDGLLEYLAPVMYWVKTPPQALAQCIAAAGGSVEIVVHPDDAQDPTFPAHIRYPPAARAAEVAYLRQVWQCFRE